MNKLIKAYNFNLLVLSEEGFEISLKYDLHPADESKVDDLDIKGLLAFVIAAS